MSAATFDFLRTLYPDGLAPNHLLLWTLDHIGDEEVKHSYWFTSIEAAAKFVGTCTAQNCYFGLCLSPADFGPHARCKADEVAVLPGIGCDIDVLSAVHKKEGLPPSIEEALRILPERFPPSFVWSSGYGLQAAWLFKEPWVLTSDEEREQAAALSQRWHTYLASEAERIGKYKIDAVHDLSHVFRVPGSLNKKVPDDPRPVEITRSSNNRYEASDLAAIMDTLGVPEREIKGADDRGRIEFGDLRLNPRVELRPELKQKLDALLANDAEFARVWRREKRMPKDNSWSGYAQSIANTLAYFGIPLQDMIDLLAFHRKVHGDQGKQRPKPLSWYTRHTIPRAVTWAKEQHEREQKREQRQIKRKEDEQQEERERVLIAEVLQGESEAQKVLLNLLELDVRRLVQIGDDCEPSYRIELVDGKTVEIPTLSAMTSFLVLNRYIWRYLGKPLPAKARKNWRAISTALGKLIEVENTGLGDVELMISDLGKYCSEASNHIFEKWPPDEYPDGPPRNTDRGYFRLHVELVRAKTIKEYKVALSLLAQPQRSGLSIPGVYYLEDDGKDPGNASGVARVLFKGPHFYDFLRKHKERRFEMDEMGKRLVAAGFQYFDTPVEQGVRLRRIWRGVLPDLAVDDHCFPRWDGPTINEHVLNTRGRVQ